MMMSALSKKSTSVRCFLNAADGYSRQRAYYPHEADAVAAISRVCGERFGEVDGDLLRRLVRHMADGGYDAETLMELSLAAFARAAKAWHRANPVDAVAAG